MAQFRYVLRIEWVKRRYDGQETTLLRNQLEVDPLHFELARSEVALKSTLLDHLIRKFTLTWGVRV